MSRIKDSLDKKFQKTQGANKVRVPAKFLDKIKSQSPPKSQKQHLASTIKTKINGSMVPIEEAKQ